MLLSGIVDSCGDFEEMQLLGALKLLPFPASKLLLGSLIEVD